MKVVERSKFGYSVLVTIISIHFAGFIELIKYLDPRVSLPCRATLANSLIPNEFMKAKAALLQELKNISYIALTTNLWSSRTMQAYMTVTSHFIDSGFQLHTRILTTILVPESHTAENLKTRLETIATEWDIANKVVCIMTDDRANKVAAIRLLTEKYREQGKICRHLSVCKTLISLSLNFTRCRSLETCSMLCPHTQFSCDSSY